MDQTRDLSGQNLYRLTRFCPAPEYVKQASVQDLCGEADMAPELFAHPVHRLFPCHTPAATWASTVYFLDKKASFKPVDAETIEQRLNWYAGYHHITHSTGKLRDQFDAFSKEAAEELPDEDYGLVIDQEGQKTRHYPLRNSPEVKKAAAYLVEHRDCFPFDLRRSFADKILNKAAELGADIKDESDFLERQAGYGGCATKTAVEFLRDRVKAAQRGPGPLSPLQEELLKLADTFERHPSKLREPGMRVKLAAVVDMYDQNTGLYRDYGDRMPRPEDILFELTNTKMASVVDEHVANPQTGTIYKLADLEQLRLDDVRSYLGDDFAEGVAGKAGFVDSEKAAELLPTMDRSFATLFDSFMNEIGISPVAKEASAETMGFSHAFLRELAANQTA